MKLNEFKSIPKNALENVFGGDNCQYTFADELIDSWKRSAWTKELEDGRTETGQDRYSDHNGDGIINGKDNYYSSTIIN